MRDAFHEDLDKISDQLVTMTTMVATALERATAALLEGRVGLSFAKGEGLVLRPVGG